MKRTLICSTQRENKKTEHCLAGSQLGTHTSGKEVFASLHKSTNDRENATGMAFGFKNRIYE